jgi:uncharacterized protein (DUF58 family)
MISLAKRDKTSHRKRLRIRPTGYGWMVVFLLLWIPLTALFTANNFLLIIFIMMVGFVAVSHTLATRNLRAVSVLRHFPSEIYSQTPFTIVYRVRTRRQAWRAITVRFREEPPLRGAGGGKALSRILADEDVASCETFTVTMRGDQDIVPGLLESSFPFGLAVYSKPYGDAESILVYPKIEPLHDVIPVHLGDLGRGIEKPDPFGTVPYLFRDYVPGDPYKHIDWKKTAQTRSLTTRVFSEEGSRDVTIRLPRDASERAISRAASLVVHFVEQGTPVGLQGPGLVIRPAMGKEHTRRLLSVLARWPDNLSTTFVKHQVTTAVIDVQQSGDLAWIDRGEVHGWTTGQNA